MDENILTRIPACTYRLQINKDFDFKSASELVGYLNDLGISDLYSSPILKARPGSLHCYDVIDHSCINPELGGKRLFQRLVSLLRKHRMGLLLDIVPNHMYAGDSNALWSSVLEYGRASSYSSFFDIDWEAPGLHGRVLLPILGESLTNCIQSKNVKLKFDCETGEFYLRIYGMRRVPLTPRSYSFVIKSAILRQIRNTEAKKNLEHLANSFLSLLDTSRSHVSKARSIYAKAQTLKKEMKSAVYSEAGLAREIERALEQIDHWDSVRASRFFKKLIGEQNYKLSDWRVAIDEINYRRFAEVNDLVALHVEYDEVFRKSHALIFELLKRGQITGLRIDHPDGLCDPTQYLYRIQNTFSAKRSRKCLKSRNSRPNSASGSARYQRLPLYLIVEKILMEGEALKSNWPVHGTTGYEFANDLTQCLTCSDNASRFNKIYEQFIGERLDCENEVYLGKEIVLQRIMRSEPHTLALMLHSISKRLPRFDELRVKKIRASLEEVICCFPVYRTYFSNRIDLEPAEEVHISEALDLAKAKRDADEKSLELLNLVLLSRPAKLPKTLSKEMNRFVMKFQQLTGPVMAKGFEDTALYNFNRLVSINEVGSNPGRFGISVAEFHERNLQRMREMPYTMLATSTHDTKRSEDVRARINVLSEMPDEWEKAIKRWGAINLDKKAIVNGDTYPSKNDEYLIYQTLVGTWPLSSPSKVEYEKYVDRIVGYMRKASKESKRITEWNNPNVAYDNAMEGFLRSIMNSREGGKDFLPDFEKFASGIGYFAMLSSLSQVLLKLTSPGVPDIYQGNEIWDFSLVDPDNRRWVDFELRQSILGDLKRRLKTEDPIDLCAYLIDNWKSGMVKMFLSRVSLKYRLRNQDLFNRGEYLPLEIEGVKRDMVISFLRDGGSKKCIVVAPRFFSILLGNEKRSFALWGDTKILLPDQLAGEKFVNLFTQERVESNFEGKGHYLYLDSVLRHFPLALISNSSQTENVI